MCTKLLEFCLIPLNIYRCCCSAENIRATMDKIISDGAAANHKVWNELSVSGLKNNIVSSLITKAGH